jgi:hypothetical protein
MSAEHVRQAAVHVHSIVREDSSPDAVSQGFRVAAGVLADRGEFSFGNDPAQVASADRLVQAVSSVLRHRDVSPEVDFSEGALDIARMTLVAWSFDRLVDEQLGREVPDGHLLDLRDVSPVVSPDEDAIGIVADAALLDHEVGDLYRTAALAAASLPDAGIEPEGTSWQAKAIAEHGGEMLGRESIAHVGIVGTRGEVEDIVMDAMIEAGNAREELLETGHSPSSDALRAAAVARMPVPGGLSPAQEGLLAVENYMQARLSRPIRPEERRMGERALDRILQEGPDAGPFDSVARTMLLDVSVQMQAARTVSEGSFGRRAKGEREAFDDVIAQSAGMDTHATGISPDRETTEAIARGAYREAPDHRIAASILDGLSDARSKPFSKAIDLDLAFQTRVIGNARSRIDAILEQGPDALTRGLGKGPRDAGTAAMGSYVARKGAER